MGRKLKHKEIANSLAECALPRACSTAIAYEPTLDDRLSRLKRTPKVWLTSREDPTVHPSLFRRIRRTARPYRKI